MASVGNLKVKTCFATTGIIGSLIGALFLWSTFESAEGQALNNIYVATLYGSNVISGSPGDPDAFGTCTIDASYEVDSILWKVDVYKIDEPTNILITSGDATESSTGVNVCPVASLIGTGNSRRYRVSSPKYGEYHIQGTLPLNESTITPIVNAPASYYCQVTTRQFQRGAVRGQFQNGIQGGVQVAISDAFVPRHDSRLTCQQPTGGEGHHLRRMTEREHH